MSGVFSSLFQRTQSAKIAVRSNTDSGSIALGEARKVSEMKLAIVKPGEPIPTTIKRPFGGAPKLRDRV